MQQLSGKTVLITGGSRGIGKAISLALAAEGCRVFINYLSDHEAAQVLVQQIASQGGRAIAVQAHIGDEKSRAELWQTLDKELDGQPLNFFIANAATGVFRESRALTLNSIRKVFAVNFEALLEMAREAVTRMPKGQEPYDAGEKGRIVAISSIGAERVIENYGSIAASKAAVEAMMRQMAFELGSLGVNCNTVRAGLVDTGILNYVSGKDQIIAQTLAKTPNGRLVNPDDVANMVVFLLSHKAAMVNGQTLMVDGGYSLMA